MSGSPVYCTTNACVYMCHQHTGQSHKIRPSGQHLFKATHHPINSLRTADKRLIHCLCSGTTHDLTHFSLLSLSVSAFPRVYFRDCTHLFVCYVCASNDAVGHDRRWHLLLMVTPAQGGPRGRAPGKEKLKGRRRDTHQPALTPIHLTLGGKNTHYCHSGPSNGNVLDVSSFLIIHADLKSRSEFSPKRTGHFLSFFWLKRF